MKRELIILGAIILVIGLVVVTSGLNNEQSTVASVQYTNIQEQGATGDYQSPVIHNTLDQIESAILG